MIKKIMTLIFALFAFCTICSALLFKALLPVYIDSAEAESGDGVYTSFYYFSDNDNCYNYFNDFMRDILSEYGIDEGNMHLNDMEGITSSKYYRSVYQD